MSPRPSKALKAFLSELSDLSEKYGFIIGGCGCCGSPYLSGNKESLDLRYDYEAKRYEAD